MGPMLRLQRPRAALIVNACARRLGSWAGPQTGNAERGFLVKKGPRGPGGSQRFSRGFAAPPSDWGEGPTGREGGGGVRHKIWHGELLG